jgi:hypothetical protein
MFLVVACLLGLVCQSVQTTGIMAAEKPKAILELSDDLQEPAVIWGSKGTKSMEDLSKEDTERFIAWFQSKSGTIKPDELLVVYKDIAFYKPTVRVFGPLDYTGKPVSGGPNQELTDGRVTITVTAVTKKPHTSVMGPSSAYPYEYVVEYTLENRGVSDVKVKLLRYVFFETSGVPAIDYALKNLKKEGNNYSETDEPFSFAPKAKDKMSAESQGDCKELNNICIRLPYSDGQESLFIVYIPPDFIKETK